MYLAFGAEDSLVIHLRHIVHEGTNLYDLMISDYKWQCI